MLGTKTQVVQDRVSLLKLELNGRALLADDGLDGIEVLVAGGGFINLFQRNSQISKWVLCNRYEVLFCDVFISIYTSNPNYFLYKSVVKGQHRQKKEGSHTFSTTFPMLPIIFIIES